MWKLKNRGCRQRPRWWQQLLHRSPGSQLQHFNWARWSDNPCPFPKSSSSLHIHEQKTAAQQSSLKPAAKPSCKKKKKEDLFSEAVTAKETTWQKELEAVKAHANGWAAAADVMAEKIAYKCKKLAMKREEKQMRAQLVEMQLLWAHGGSSVQSNFASLSLATPHQSFPQNHFPSMSFTPSTSSTYHSRPNNQSSSPYHYYLLWWAKVLLQGLSQ